MRVYGYATASFYTYLILMLTQTATSKQQDILDKHYDSQRDKVDKTTPPNSKTVRLYSKSSGKFVQVLKRIVNASGAENSETGTTNTYQLGASNVYIGVSRHTEKYLCREPPAGKALEKGVSCEYRDGLDYFSYFAAILVLESQTFGKVRIRHYRSHYYICMNAKGEIIGLSEKKGKRMKRCVFTQKTAKDTFIQFVSDKYGIKDDEPRYLAFRNSGEPKLFNRVVDSKQRATKFLFRPANINKPRKRNVKRNILKRRREKHEFVLQEKKKLNERQNRKVCSRYFRCLHKNWKMRPNGNISKIFARCSRVFRRNNCRCKCAKQ